MDRGVHPSLPIIKGIPFSAAHYVKARGGRGFVCLCCDGLPCDELVLIRVDNGVQMPIYYVSKSLHEVEIHYLPLEKAILAMVHATRKLPHYFQLYTVVVLTQLPLRALLRSADFIGRISKWGTTLGAFDFKYMLHTSVKGQVLADLVADFIEFPMEEEVKNQGTGGKSVGMVFLKKPLHNKSEGIRS